MVKKSSAISKWISEKPYNTFHFSEKNCHILPFDKMQNASTAIRSGI